MEMPSMSAANLESRVAALEVHYTQLLTMLQAPPARNAWRQVVGMFADDPDIELLHDEIQRIREADRIASRDEGAS
jgi:hypothetical protein